MLRRNRFVALAVCLVLSVAFSVAQAAPTFGIRTDHEDGVFIKGETATFTVTMADDGTPVASAEVPCELSTDGFIHSEKRTLTIKDGKAELTASRDEPCILWLRVTYPQEGTRPITAVGGAAFSPTEILPSMPAPDDFDQFWAEQKKRIDAIPANVQLAPMDSGNPDIELYCHHHGRHQRHQDLRLPGEAERRRPVPGACCSCSGRASTRWTRAG